MLITERASPMIGIADSASQGNVGQAQIRYRPITRPGEVLETIPGMIATQHSGEGKANQYFLRGFNLDHGTDFLIQIEGVLINQLSHSHGQCWTDTNFLIPELIETLEYKKGINYAENGDFASTGSANIRYFKKLPETMIRFTGGSFDYYRGFKLIRKPAIHNQEARNMILRRILLISADSIPRPWGESWGQP